MKTTKFLGKVGGVLSTVLIVLEIVLILFVVVSKMMGGTPALFGYQMYVVVTPSMEPEIRVGDVLISKKYTGGELREGDVITYLGREGDLAGKMITHEIIAIQGEGDHERIIAKGIANSAPDPAITREDIASVMVYKTVLIGFIYSIISSTWGFWLLVVAPLVVMIVAEIVTLVREIKKEGEKSNENEQDQP